MLALPFHILLFAGAAHAGSGASFVSSDASAFIGGKECRKATVIVEAATISIECNGLVRSSGVVMDLEELDNIRWETGITKGKLVAEQEDGTVLWIEVPKREMDPLRAAMSARLAEG